jgi:hypothetical protein
MAPLMRLENGAAVAEEAQGRVEWVTSAAKAADEDKVQLQR